MYHDLHKSFDCKLSNFWNYQRLADSQKNPFRKDDFITAVFIAGKLRMIASILSKEWGDTSRNDEVEEVIKWCTETSETI